MHLSRSYYQLGSFLGALIAATSVLLWPWLPLGLALAAAVVWAALWIAAAARRVPAAAAPLWFLLNGAAVGVTAAGGLAAAVIMVWPAGPHAAAAALVGADPSTAFMQCSSIDATCDMARLVRAGGPPAEAAALAYVVGAILAAFPAAITQRGWAALRRGRAATT